MTRELTKDEIEAVVQAVKKEIKPEFERMNRKFEALAEIVNRTTSLSVITAEVHLPPEYIPLQEKKEKELNDNFKVACKKIDDDIDNRASA